MHLLFHAVTRVMQTREFKFHALLQAQGGDGVTELRKRVPGRDALTELRDRVRKSMSMSMIMIHCNELYSSTSNQYTHFHVSNLRLVIIHACHRLSISTADSETSSRTYSSIAGGSHNMES